MTFLACPAQAICIYDDHLALKLVNPLGCVLFILHA